jgi:hypothetical protein
MTEPVFHESHAKIGHERGRFAERLAILGLVLVIVLVVKPWGSTPEPAAGPPPRAIIAPTPETLSFSELPCTGRMWLIEADTRWAGEVVRSWILTDAVAATGPTDPTIKFVVVAAQQVLSIGYCPSYRDDNRPHDRLTIYRLDSTVTTVPTTTVRVPQEAEAAANDLFAPLSTPGPSGAGRQLSWGPGRYVIRIDGSDGYLRWLGLEIRIVAAGSQATPAIEAP